MNANSMKRPLLVSFSISGFVFGSLSLLALLPAILGGSRAGLLQENMVELDATQLDFGTLVREANVPAFREVSIRNLTNAPVTIARLSVSCGCVGAQSVPHVIGPRETGLIRVSVDSSQKGAGRFHHMVVATISGARTELHQVELVGRVTELLDVVPSALSVGRFNSLEGFVRSVTIRNNSTSPVRIERLYAQKGMFDVSCQQDVLEPNVPTQLRVSAPANGAEGLLEDRVMLVLNGPVVKRREIPVCGSSFAGHVFASPRALNFGLCVAGKEYERKISFRSSQAIPFAIVDAAAAGVPVDIRYESGRSASHTVVLRLRCAQDETQGVHSGKIVLSTESEQDKTHVTIDATYFRTR